MPHRIGALTVLLLWSGCGWAADQRLIGVWKAVTYRIGGKDQPLQGLFIFTKGHYSADVRFKKAKGPIDDANGNAGPYTADGRRIVFKQWVQIHVRPEDAKEPVLSREGPDETTEYRFETNRLILTFPSKNRYVLERIEE